MKSIRKFHNAIDMTKVPDLMGQALQFRVAMDQPIAKPEGDLLNKAESLISEEYLEFLAANSERIAYPRHQQSQENSLKELADLVYVCFQFAALAGWELDEALDRVHTSNMSKMVNGKPMKDENGKVQKGPNYKPPFLDDLI